MNTIAAVSADWGIGKENDLLFHIPEDLKFFRQKTAGGTLILGRKNLESFPGGRPLPRRRHLVLSRRSDWQPDGVEVYHSIPEILEAVKDLPPEEVWVVGGGEIYRQFLPYCREAWITHVDARPAADVFFPDLSLLPEWSLAEAGAWQRRDLLSYRFCRYTNKNFVYASA